MLNINVKTMDSQSRLFNVPESITLKDFKARISGPVGIPADQQRLILQGRVLQDDFILTQEHNDKTLHLVQRLPVSTTTVASMSTESNNPPPTTTQANVFPGVSQFPGASQFTQMIQNTVGNLGQMLGDAVFNGNPSNPNEPGMNFPTCHFNISSSPHPHSHPHPHPQPHNQGISPQARPVVSTPRQQLSSTNRILDQASQILDQLESINTTSETDVSENQDGVFAAPVNNDNGPDVEQTNDTDVGNTDGTSQAGNTATGTAPRPSCANHPSLQELGATFTRMIEAQRRLEPFQTKIATFFNEDPAFTSTNSAEYRTTARLLKLTLQGQQMLSRVQQMLSHVAIPLGNTPPRVMLVRAQPGPVRVHPPTSGGRSRIGTGAPNHPIPNQARFMPHSAHTTVMRARLPNMPNINRPLHNPPFPQMPQLNTAGQPRPRMHQFQFVYPGNAPQQSTPPRNQTNPLTYQRSGTGATTQFTITPPQYTVQMNATIQPQIQITMDPNAQMPPTTAANQPTARNTTSTTTNSTTNQQNGVHVVEMNIHDSNLPTMNGQLPNIPGVPHDMLTNIFQSVAQQVQQQVQQQAGGDMSDGGVGGGHGMLVVQGPPGGPNQVQDDISNILGQGMFGAINQHMQGGHGSAPFNFNLSSGVPFPIPTPSPSTAMSTSTVSTGTTTQTSNSTSNIGLQTSHTPAPATAGAGVDGAGATNMAERLVSNGAFGSRPAQHSGTSDEQRIANGDQFIGALCRNLCAREPGTMAGLGILQHVLEAAIHLTSGDWRNLPHPATAQSTQDRWQSIFQEQYFGGRTNPPTDEQIEECTEKSSEEMRPYCERMFEGADTFADVDIVESNLSLYRYTMRKMIKIAFNCDMATFSREFTKHLQLMGSIFFRLNESLLRGRRQAVADCLMRGLGDGYSMIDKAFSMCAVIVKQEQIDQFVMNSKPYPSTEAIVVEPVSQTPLVVDGPKIEIDDTGSEDLNKTDEASGSSDDWKLHVPEAWVDTISNDIEKQKSLKPQPPFSEAYIAGMPASKRRKVGKTD